MEKNISSISRSRSQTKYYVQAGNHVFPAQTVEIEFQVYFRDFCAFYEWCRQQNLINSHYSKFLKEYAVLWIEYPSRRLFSEMRIIKVNKQRQGSEVHKSFIPEKIHENMFIICTNKTNW